MLPMKFCSRLKHTGSKSISGLVSRYVPKHENISEYDLNTLKALLDEKPGIVALTGAGISTESGIPDYRSEGVGLYATSSKRPMQYQEFVKSPEKRQSYWARNFVGWPSFSSHKPNVTHLKLAEWEKTGKISWIVTQNVDRLHHKAGNKKVIELHGTSFIVHCLSCKYQIDRHYFQTVLEQYNPQFNFQSDVIRPDADVELSQDIIQQFVVPDCDKCGGNLIPYVVFFGDSVPTTRVDKVKSVIRNCNGLLCLGTSLHVYSGYRFVLEAHERKKPIFAINIGETRADHLLTYKLNGRCGEVFSKL